MRLQKLLAEAGLGSRRQVESWIALGRLAINGTTARLGDRATHDDAITLDGRAIPLVRPATVRVLAYHKPVGEIVTRSDPRGRRSVFENLPPLEQGKWVAVGRLDYDTSGLLLLTSSGDLANHLMHPRYEVERVYSVRIRGALAAGDLDRLREGIEIGDGPAAFESIEATAAEGADRWYCVRLREGRNREVRRMFEAVGRRVNRLVRTQYGPVTLARELEPGRWRELGAHEVAKLMPPSAARNVRQVVRQVKSC